MQCFAYRKKKRCPSFGFMNKHRQLKAWQRCQELAVGIYAATKAFPDDERYGITSQIRRAAVSSSSNIAEGYGRTGRNEFVRFLTIALASLAEVDSLLAVSTRLGYLTSTEEERLYGLHASASQLTYALLKRPGR